MRLGLLIYGDLDTRSGGYLYDRQLVQALEAAGDQVAVISLPPRNYPRHLLDNFSTDLLTRLISANCDVLLQDELNHPSLFLINRRLKRMVSTPLVAIVHHLRSNETSRLRRFYRLIEGSYLKGLDGAIYNSPSTQQTVEALVTIPGVVALPGCDHLDASITDDEIVSRVRQPGPLKVIFIGNLIPRKGLDTLLRALAHLPLQTWSLMVIGNPEIDMRYSRAMVRLCADLGIEGQVHFLGYRSSREVTALLEDGHLLAVPSQDEGFGIVYLEAMGYGLPPLASAAGGAKDLIRHGENGYLVQPGDVEGLVALLQKLHNDRDHLTHLSLAARCTYASHPSWSQSAALVRSFLKNLPQDSL